MQLRTNQFKNTSDFQGESGSATLNMEKLSLFMENMISNYNYPELAVLREWVSNAHDSHVASGVKEKIQVTLPTQLSPTLIVKDSGAGMSHEFVTDSYLCIGTSTKDKEDNEIGGFGQGAKSALAIASQYTMITIHEGLKSIFILERSPMGGIDYKAPIVRVPTDEPSGVTVQVAVDRIGEYNDTNVNRVLAGWSNSDIELTNGKEFFSIPDNSVQVNFEVEGSQDENGNMEIFEETGYVLNGAFEASESKSRMTRMLGLGWQDYIVLVGPVAYIFQPELRSTRVLNEYMVPSVGIGRVSFPSSREVIESTRSNRDYVGRCISKVAEAADELLQLRANSLKTHREALQLHTSPIAQKRSDFKVNFRDEPVPVSFTPQTGDQVFEYEHTGGWRGVKNYKLSEKLFHTDSTFRLNIEMLVILDDPSLTTQSIRNNARLYHTSQEHQPKDLRGYLLITETPSAWLKAAARFEVKATELAELAKEHRKKIREEAAAAKANGTTPAPAVRKTRTDRIGEYSAHWLTFETNEDNKLAVSHETSDLMDFFTNVLDKSKTLVISTRGSESLYPRDFARYFQSFEVNPSDAQFLYVDTGAKLKTLRLLLGDEDELTIVDFRSWMDENFSNLISNDNKSPQKLAEGLPFEPSQAIVQFLNMLGLESLHPKYREIIDIYNEIGESEKKFSPIYYSNVSSYMRSVLRGLYDYEVNTRPEFFILENMGYVYRVNEAEKATIRSTLNYMVQSWMDNLALEEEEASEESASSENTIANTEANSQ